MDFSVRPRGSVNEAVFLAGDCSKNGFIIFLIFVDVSDIREMRAYPCDVCK